MPLWSRVEIELEFTVDTVFEEAVLHRTSVKTTRLTEIVTASTLSGAFVAGASSRGRWPGQSERDDRTHEKRATKDHSEGATASSAHFEPFGTSRGWFHREPPPDDRRRVPRVIPQRQRLSVRASERMGVGGEVFRPGIAAPSTSTEPPDTGARQRSRYLQPKVVVLLSSVAAPGSSAASSQSRPSAPPRHGSHGDAHRLCPRSPGRGRWLRHPGRPAATQPPLERLHSRPA